MKPLYEQLKRQHYSSNRSRPGYVPAAQLFAELGYDHDALLKKHPDFINTCAVRMSLALLKNSVEFTGRFPINSEQFKGKKFEPGAKLLADQLYRPNVFGKAEIYTDARDAALKLINRRGVVFFNKIENYGGGHIDLIEPLTHESLVCNSDCFPNSKEIWFWELQ